MAIKSVLTLQTDFISEFPLVENMLALRRFNKAAPDSDIKLADSSGYNRRIFIFDRVGAMVSLPVGRYGLYFKHALDAF